MTTTQNALCFFAIAALTACASAQASDTSGGPTSEPTGEPAPAVETAAAAHVMPDTVPARAALSFSTEQADRGRNAFRASCTECHNSSEFSDGQFKFKWRRRSAGDLFGHIAGTMPEDAPGSLSAQAYVDVVAYILRINGFEAGEGELPADEEALEALSLAPIGN